MTDDTISAEASPASETPAVTEADAPAQATTDVAAESSTADAKEAPPSLLDVVKSVVQPKEPEPTAPSAAEAEKPAEGGEADAPKELSEAEIAELPFHNHPRFKELVTQRNTLKGELETTTAKLRDLEAPAEQWGNVRAFMKTNSLSDDDMLRGFKMMAMIRTDPLKGRAELASYLTEVDKALGLVLPEDLRADVESGFISEERAFELSKTRARASQQEATIRETRENEERAQATQTQREHAQRLTSAAEAWETARRARDPDFDAKQDLIADRMRAIAQAERLQPRSVEEINALLDRAYTDVSTHLRRFVPAPKPVARPTSAAPSTVAAPAPKNMREAIALAARGT